MSLRERAVWITGVGVATPLGFTFGELASNLMEGRSGVGPVDRFDTTDQPCTVAACLGTIPCPEGYSPGDFEGLGPWEKVLTLTAVDALRDAGLWERRRSLRVGMVVGIGGEWVLHWEASMLKGGRGVHEPPRDRDDLTTFTRRVLGLNG
ncbi:MAG: beta-ketoacyl synthase N-terminal-like domain-containing protein, partial [Isosphaeraceae bacterium]